jgi:Tol biopolymer transport system component
LEALSEAEGSAPGDSARLDRAGTLVGRYRVAELLGRGGMGEVYAALDTDLSRPVALKFLLPHSLGNATAVKRFVREAKAASAMNHPNIVTIHEVIDSSSGLAIAMELVEGEPLSVLRGSVLAWRQVVEIGRQVAVALAAAHAQSSVHRDIKPENLMLRPDGIVKVLDFGLARSFSGNGANSFQFSSMTGLPGGTLRYMSPEQLRNEPLTGGSDVYSLGLVLYELITGCHPFESSWVWETAYAIHSRDPQPPSAANRETPAWLDALIVSMLNRDAALRPAANDVASALSLGAWEKPPSTTRSAWANWKLMLCAAAIAGMGGAAWSVREQLPPWRLKTVEFTRYAGDEDMPSLSPDGRAVAFAWNGPGQNNVDIYVKTIGSTAVQRITTNPLSDFSPAWSPEGTAIAFLRKPSTSSLAEVFLVPPGGGQERKVTDISLARIDEAPSVAWTPDGKWLIAPSRESEGDPVGLFRISPTDGTKLRLTRPPPDQSDRAPAISPNGRILSFARSNSESVYSIYLLPLSSTFIAAGEPQALPSFPNLRVGTPQWTPDGKELLFGANPAAGMAIWRMRVPAAGEAPQPPRREMYAERSFRIRIGPPSAAAHRLVYSSEIQERNLWRVALGTLGGSPALERVGAPGENNASARISPDGTRIAFDSMRTGSTEIWAANIDGSKPRQLTNFKGPVTGSPAWSPDGRRIAFDSRVEGRPHIYVIPAEGGRPERITEALAENLLPSWSHDGQWIYFSSSRSGALEIWRHALSGGRAEQLTHSGGWAPAESPDGTALYYERLASAGWALRRLNLKTGDDVEILPGIIDRAFELAREGVYYIPVPGTDGKFRIQFYDLRTGVSRLVTPILKPMTRCLSLAPDGSFLLYSQLDRWGLDLMLVENFH